MTARYSSLAVLFFPLVNDRFRPQHVSLQTLTNVFQRKRVKRKDAQEMIGGKEKKTRRALLFQPTNNSRAKKKCTRGSSLVGPAVNFFYDDRGREVEGEK